MEERRDGGGGTDGRKEGWGRGGGGRMEESRDGVGMKEGRVIIATSREAESWRRRTLQMIMHAQKHVDTYHLPSQVHPQSVRGNPQHGQWILIRQERFTGRIPDLNLTVTIIGLVPIRIVKRVRYP